MHSMTSWGGNTFHIAGLLYRETTNLPVDSLDKWAVMQNFHYFFIVILIKPFNETLSDNANMMTWMIPGFTVI